MQNSPSDEFSAFYARHGRPVRNFLFRLGARSALDDLVQETFVRAWIKRESLRDVAAEKAWIFQIALHGFYDWTRRKDSHWQDLTEAEHPTTLGSARQIESRMDADTALRSLPIEQRTVCLLFYIEEFSVAEIARLEKVPEGTVKTRLMKAREKMQALLTDLPKRRTNE